MSLAVSTSDAASVRRPDVSFHLVILGLAAAVVFLSCVLRIVDGRRVMIPVLDCPLPGVCTYQRWFGIECPGCGLTRCFISLGHGDPVAAWHFNPAGVLGFSLVVAQIPYRVIQLSRIRRGRDELRLARIGQTWFWLFFGLLIGQWILKVFL